MGSQFARATKTIDIPFDLPNTATIRQLNGRQMGRASSAFFNQLITEVVQRGGAEIQKEIAAMFAKDPKAAETDVAAVQADPLNGYDKYQLCYDGIVSWSLPDSLDRVAVEELNAAGRKITVMRVKAIDEMTDEALTFYATEILRLSKPSLFMTPEEAKVEQKND